MSDVVVIGAGPNGLVAANVLADHGLDVVVCEAQPEPGGAVRSAQVTEPGFEHDLYSAFYPFAASSPAMRALRLEEHGLRWRRAPHVLAHPAVEGPAAILDVDVDVTAASLDAFSRGDGDAWRELYAEWTRVSEPFMEAFTTPFPPVRATAPPRPAAGPAGLARLAKLSVLTVRRLGAERFAGGGGPLLLAGNALHADLTPDSAGGALFGWILTAMGQQHGFPVPEGGAGRLTDALVRRLAARGGARWCATPGRRGPRPRRPRRRRPHRRRPHVRRAAGHRRRRGRAAALHGAARRRPLPARVRLGLRRFRYDSSTVKVDWALREPIPWTDPEVRRAGTVHVADGLGMLGASAAELERGLIPARPFLVMGQYACLDPTRQPEGADTAWAYTHVPQHTRGDGGGTLTGRWDRSSSTCSPSAWRPRSSASPRASATASSRATSPDRTSSSAPTRTWSAARSTAAPRSCASSSCCARSPARPGRRRACAACTSARRPRTRAAACTARPAATRLARSSRASG